MYKVEYIILVSDHGKIINLKKKKYLHYSDIQIKYYNKIKQKLNFNKLNFNKSPVNFGTHKNSIRPYLKFIYLTLYYKDFWLMLSNLSILKKKINLLQYNIIFNV